VSSASAPSPVVVKALMVPREPVAPSLVESVARSSVESEARSSGELEVRSSVEPAVPDVLAKTPVFENHVEHTAPFPDEETAQAPYQPSLYPMGKVPVVSKSASVQDAAPVPVVPKTL
jgi:hypothetical protein